MGDTIVGSENCVTICIRFEKLHQQIPRQAPEQLDSKLPICQKMLRKRDEDSNLKSPYSFIAGKKNVSIGRYSKRFPTRFGG